MRKVSFIRSSIGAVALGAALVALAAMVAPTAPVNEVATPFSDQGQFNVPLDELIGVQGVTTEPLARGGFPDRIDASFNVRLGGGDQAIGSDVRNLADLVSAQLTIEPDGFVGWHTHPGPGIVTVVAGALTIVNEIDCIAREYRAGEGFIDPGQGNVHVAYNASDEETRVHAVFLDVPPGDGPTILLEEPGDCPR